MTDTIQKIADEMRNSHKLGRVYMGVAPLHVEQWAERLSSLSAGASGGGVPDRKPLPVHMPGQAYSDFALLRAEVDGWNDCIDAMLTAPASPATGQVATDTCSHCGAPCRKEVLMRGGDNGWGDDATRTVFRYVPPTPQPESAGGEWVMVPREPTEAMLSVGTGGARGLKRALWLAMVDAARQPSAERDVLAELRRLMDGEHSDREAALVSFFRTTGAAMGRHGDAMGWTPEQTARHFLAAPPPSPGAAK